MQIIVGVDTAITRYASFATKQWQMSLHALALLIYFFRAIEFNRFRLGVLLFVAAVSKTI